jgi:hypothetical protein
MTALNQPIFLKEFPRRLIYKINSFLGLHPSSKPYISGDTFRRLADHTIDSPTDLRRKRNLKSGDVIFCNTGVLTEFIEVYSKKIDVKFILITHNSDYVIDLRHSALLRNENLIHWFAQNNTLIDNKISTIPIGLENKLYYNHGRVDEFHALRKATPNKRNKILCAFSTHTNPNIRLHALSVLQRSPCVEQVVSTNAEYKRVLLNFRFVASPAGNGLDCHRTWEALYLGTIPIVVGKKFYQSFPGFPGLVLDEWEDLLILSAAELNDIFTAKSIQLKTTNFIWIDYWANKIATLKLTCR